MIAKTQVSDTSRLPCGGTPYKDVARLLSKHHASPGMCLDFIDLFATNNPNFNQAQFLTICGLKEE
ncbi:hypothetical protein LCGC14_2455460 [marine sediment metagenome]|uniref:Uncharacterized protein n=1 Tax=marine sediment metagenome TaxID=412755 RepID=A0A0F9BFC2_9ZZZZ